MPITSKEQLKDYTLRRNGYPVIEVNVADEQLEDNIELAVQLSGVGEAWNHPKLKEVAAAFVRRQWAHNLMKFNGIQVLGGATIDADSLLRSANCDLRRLLGPNY